MDYWVESIVLQIVIQPFVVFELETWDKMLYLYGMECIFGQLVPAQV